MLKLLGAKFSFVTFGMLASFFGLYAWYVTLIIVEKQHNGTSMRIGLIAFAATTMLCLTSAKFLIMDTAGGKQ